MSQERCLRGLRAAREAGVEVRILSNKMAVESFGGYYLPIWTPSNTLTLLLSYATLAFGRTDSERGITDDDIIRGPHDGILLCSTQEYLPPEFQNTIPVRRVQCSFIGHVDVIGWGANGTFSDIIIQELRI